MAADASPTSEPLDPADWRPMSVAEVASVMRGAPCRWWIAGGWAIDLWLGRTTRVHADTDIAILTSDQLAVQRHLSPWFLYKTKQPTPSRLAPWPAGDYLAPSTGVHDIWVKAELGGPWRFQLMLTEDVDDRWVFRRDRRVGGAIADLGWTNTDGLPVLRPEVQLLYKSRQAGRRAKDQADFESSARSLTPVGRDWLAGAIRLIDGDEHDWLARLAC